MFKKILLGLLLFVFAAAAFTSYNARPQAILARLAGKDIAGASELSYRIYLLGLVPAGKAIFYLPEEKNTGTDAFSMLVSARTLRYFCALFSAQAQMQSIIDPHTLNPQLFRQTIAISGKPELYREALYDQKRNILTVAGVERQIYPDTQDPLSAIYRIMRMGLLAGNSFEMSLNNNHKNYLLSAQVNEKEISALGKKFPLAVVKAKIARRGKSPYHQSQITMILLKGRPNIPVLIRVFAGGMVIKAKLTDIK